MSNNDNRKPAPTASITFHDWLIRLPSWKQTKQSGRKQWSCVLPRICVPEQTKVTYFIFTLYERIHRTNYFFFCYYVAFCLDHKKEIKTKRKKTHATRFPAILWQSKWFVQTKCCWCHYCFGECTWKTEHDIEKRMAKNTNKQRYFNFLNASSEQTDTI